MYCSIIESKEVWSIVLEHGELKWTAEVRWCINCALCRVRELSIFNNRPVISLNCVVSLFIVIDQLTAINKVQYGSLFENESEMYCREGRENVTKKKKKL